MRFILLAATEAVEITGLLFISTTALHGCLKGELSCWFHYQMTGWGARIRTWDCRYQKPMPYHLATPQQREHARCARGLIGRADGKLNAENSKSAGLIHRFPQIGVRISSSAVGRWRLFTPNGHLIAGRIDEMEPPAAGE